MKYIRLKDKIYTDDNLYTITKVYEDNRFKVGDKVLSTDKIFEKVEEKDIANTIEELCDEFVVDNWEEKNKPILCKYVKERNALYYCDENGINWLYIPDLLKMKIVVYSAIWTDKGLIYVAKMNDKGELELL